MSLFRRKKSTKQLSSTDSSPLPRSSSGSFLSSSRRSTPLSTPPTLHVDDFGRPVDRPAFSTQSLNRSPRDLGAPFGEGFGVGEDGQSTNGGNQEMQLLYGYAPLATTLEFGIAKVEDIVSKCAVEIRQRGLDTPLIMSSTALDISMEGVCSLIRSYLEDSKTWEHDLQFAAPLSVGAFIKWSLARLVNDQGGRGFLGWEAYKDFKNAEKARGFQPKSCTMYLIARLPSGNGRLLASLLSLFSSIAAHSGKNGMPPRRLASLFSPYIFGLVDDQNFDQTYDEWQRATDATEHIILSYIRDQQADGPLPTFLEKFVIGYPSILNISWVGAPPKVPDGARTEEVTRVRRLTRFHSRNLIASAGTWEVPHSASWQLFFNSSPSLSASTSSTSAPTPVYSSAYRHLLNIRSNSGLDDDYEEENETGRYKTRIDKEWSKFGELGFSDVDEKKLEFDLTEGERAVQPVPQNSMDWNTFESSGFAGRELFAPNDLVFQHSLNQRVNTWPSAAKSLNDRLRATEKLLPAFPYDTTPHEEPRLTIDSLFFEAWADVLVGGGWARDELKESSFALIQWRSRPRPGDMAKNRSSRSPGSAGDSRTEDRWVLVEEFVPKEYREALTDPKVKKAPKRISFLRTVRRKNTVSSKPPPSAAVLLSPPLASSRTAGISNTSASATSSPRSLRPIDESVFTNENAQTTKLSLSSPHLERNSYATGPSTSYAPSVVSTAVANDGHAALSTLSLADSQHQPHDGHFRHRSSTPPPPVPSHNIYGMNGGDQPKMPKRGFLARINTMRNREKSRNGGEGAFAPPGMSSEINNSSVDSFPPPQVASNGIVPDWTDARPNAPPVLGAVVDSFPPTPPPKSNGVQNGESAHLRDPAVSSRNLDSSRMSTMTTSTNPYGGMDDSSPTVEREEGQVMFRGSRSYENGLSEVADGSHREEEEIMAAQPRQHPRMSNDSPIEETNPRQTYLSGSSAFSSRVANIVGLYEQRDRPTTQSDDARSTQYTASSPRRP